MKMIKSFRIFCETVWKILLYEPFEKQTQKADLSNLAATKVVGSISCGEQTAWRITIKVSMFNELGQ